MLPAGAFADDLQRFIQGVEDNAEAFKDVDSLAKLCEDVLITPTDGLQTEIEKVPQHLDEADAFRFEFDRRSLLDVFLMFDRLSRHQTSEVAGEVVLEFRVFEEVRHRSARISAFL